MFQITSVIWVQINLVFSFPQPCRLFDMLLLGKSNLSFQFQSVTSVVKIRENNFYWIYFCILESSTTVIFSAVALQSLRPFGVSEQIVDPKVFAISQIGLFWVSV